MLWAFIAIMFSGWLYVDASYRGPLWQLWLFQSITFLLLITLTWKALEKHTTPIGYFVLLGLLATFFGSILLILSRKQLIYAMHSFFFSYVFYIIGFFQYMLLENFWLLTLMFFSSGILLMMYSWMGLDKLLKQPIFIGIIVSILMVWIAGEQYYQHHTNYHFSILVGSVLLFIKTAILAISYYWYPCNVIRAMFSAFSFLGHFLIVRSLYL
ncbi:putative membrane protein [secondary endosymbiont of Heteropsylla cubana]|uniref:Putative membrane protein n=1 Tax=secondary endosymbiont of Heteropsylla cubana TaxID=134287 RepID=J3Z5E7_9ENTR|nr:lysoplasmalogenase family protein [secondary endosymbiont of Heteropsylla cubana]AFP85554.1 putative membrane protein [secondary endosymbiont of Heteropsylla cubana]